MTDETFALYAIAVLTVLYALTCAAGIRGTILCGFMLKKWAYVQTQFHYLVAISTALRVVDLVLFIAVPEQTLAVVAFVIVYEWIVTFIFYLCFIIVALYWFELSSLFDNDSVVSIARARRRRYQIIAFLSCFSGLLFFSIFVGFMAATGDPSWPDVIISGFYFPFLAFFTAVIFIVYGRRLHKKLNGQDSFRGASVERKRSVRNILTLAIVCTVAFLVRCILAAVFDNYATANISAGSFLIVYVLFFFLIEWLPVTIVLYMLQPRGKVRSSSSAGPRMVVRDKHQFGQPLMADSAGAPMAYSEGSGTYRYLSPSSNASYFAQNQSFLRNAHQGDAEEDAHVSTADEAQVTV